MNSNRNLIFVKILTLSLMVGGLLLGAGAAEAADISGTISSTLTIFDDSQLVGNVTCTANGPCIVFGADDITLRLNGFTITGLADPILGCRPASATTHGGEIGIGTTMLLHCDLVYTAGGARFQLPFVNLGLCPEAASSAILPALMGTHRAAELLLFGEPFDAEAARDLGVVNHVVAEADLLPTATAKAQLLSQKPPAALQTTKVLLRSGQVDVIKQAMTREGQQFAALLQGPEAKEAMAAFLERRKPDFSRF